MPEKTIALPAHKKFVASLTEMAPTFATIAKNPKVMKMPTGVQATVSQYHKLVTWFTTHQAEYELLVASQVAAAKPKTARAGG
ncbi:MAG TPA: hypothetical protein VK752_05310 [Bryobacteraceae bacterium]|jgi:hypothetical protein|nr:hypothetical protein [Bryobacteraceae bacterium]